MNFKRPLSDSLCFIVNKFEHVWQEGVQVEQVNISRGVPVWWGPSWTSLNMSGGESQDQYGGQGPVQKGAKAGPWVLGPLAPSQFSEQTDRHYWKHYLPAISLAAGGKN